MANVGIDIGAKISGADQWSKNLTYAPKVYRRRLAGALWQERDLFIGNKKKPGVWRRKLQRKSTAGQRVGLSGGGFKWSKQFAALFQGWVPRAETIAGLQLKMGVWYRQKRQAHVVAEFLGTGGSITSQNEMIVPNYKNLALVGVFPKTGKSHEALLNYESLTGGRKLFANRYGQMTKYFDTEMAETGSYQKALMFVGTKKVKVKKQYDFHKSWAGRKNGLVKRLLKSTQRANTDIEKGKTK